MCKSPQQQQQHIDKLQPILSVVGTSSSEGQSTKAGVSMRSGTSTRSKGTKSSFAKAKSQPNSRRKKRSSSSRSKSRSKSRDRSDNKDRQDHPSLRGNNIRSTSNGSTRQRKLSTRNCAEQAMNTISHKSGGGIPG